MPRRMGADDDPNAVPATLSWQPVLLTLVMVGAVTMRAMADGWSDLGWIVGAALALMAGLWWWIRAHSLARHRALSEQHPSDDVVEVVGARDLRATLAASDLLEPDGLRWWHNVTLSAVVTDEGLSLWRGGRQPVLVADVPWAQVTEVGIDSASLSSAGPRPVAGVMVRAQWVLHLAPQRRRGSLLGGGERATELLVVLLRAHLDAARSASGGAVTWTRAPGTGAASLALQDDDERPVPLDAVTEGLRAFAAELRDELADLAEVETDGDDDAEVVVLHPQQPLALVTGWFNDASALAVLVGDGALVTVPRDLGGLETVRSLVRAALDGHVDVGRAPGVAGYRIHLPDGSVHEATARTPAAALLAWFWRPRLHWAPAARYGAAEDASRG